MTATYSSAGQGAPSRVTEPPPPSLQVQSPSLGPGIGPDGHYELYIYNGSLMPYNNVSYAITTTMWHDMEVGACTFEMISPERLLNYWEKFQSKCRWDPALTDEVYRCWHEISGFEYEDMLSIWKKKWDEEEKIPFCDTAVWQALLAYWNSDRHSEPASPGTSINHNHRADEVAPARRIREKAAGSGMSQCGGVSKRRCISGCFSSGVESARLYSEDEVEFLVAVERSRLPKILKEKLDIMHKEIDPAREETWRKLLEEQQECWDRMNARLNEMWMQGPNPHYADSQGRGFPS